MEYTRKIVVIGAGNAGCVTALQHAWHSRTASNIEVELIHNPEVSPTRVGQATLLDAAGIFHAALGMNWYNNPIHATPKSGFKYEGWGKKNENIFHEFPMDRLGLHFCPVEMQQFVLKSGLFKVTEGDVDPKDVDADYVFDCRGTPDDLSEYRELNNPINACILGKPNWNTLGELWTRCVATPDGWTFVIPMHPESPSHNGSVGYLYNSNITSKEDAEKNFLEQFDVEITDSFNFNNYMSTNPVVDGRIFLNGNRLFFLEPLESTAIQVYMDWARAVGEFLFVGRDNPEMYLQEKIQQIENFILWHYQLGSKYDTPFWDYAKALKMSTDDRYFSRYIQWAEDHNWRDVIGENYGGLDDLPAYGLWGACSFKRWKEGVGV